MFKMYDYFETPIEKEFAILESVLDINTKKAYAAYEYVDKMHEISLLESDVRVMNESGGLDELTYYYEDATEQAVGKKKNIVKTIIDGIVKFINGIFEKIRKLFDKKTEEEFNQVVEQSDQMETKQEPKKLFDKAKDFGSKVLEFLKPGFHSVDADGNKQFDAVRTAVTAVEAVGGAVIAAKALPGVKKQGENLLDMFKGLLGKAQKKVDEAKDDKEIGFFSRLVGDIKKVSSSIGSAVTDTCGYMTKLAKSKFSKVKGDVKKAGKEFGDNVKNYAKNRDMTNSWKQREAEQNSWRKEAEDNDDQYNVESVDFDNLFDFDDF